ncbi:MAG: SDR family oxidoreductase [Pseudomonadota bacterium]
MKANQTFDFTGQTVLVTGGAKGVGRGIVDAFLEAGATVIICGRNKPDHMPEGAHFIAADVRDHAAAPEIVKFAIGETGRLDCVINNAGGSPPADAASASPRFSESIIKLNLLAPLHLAQAAYEPLAASETGAIVNIGSVSGVRPSPGTAAYGAAKAGLLGLTRSLAMEWAPRVRVNAIIAGLVRTEASHAHYGGPEGVAYIESHLPMKRMAIPEDIAKACLFLCAPSSTYVSGAALEVHGSGEPPSFLGLAEAALAAGETPQD